MIVKSKRHQTHEASKVFLQAGNDKIKPSENETLLGATIDSSGGWKAMLRDGDESVLKQLTTKINGLKKVLKNADFKTRLAVATGIVQSKLQYLMPLWIGAPKYLVNTLQVQQLNAARTVCGYKSYYWSTTKLLNTCGWLSVRQQMVYSTVNMAHNILTTGVPKNIYANFEVEHPYRTRQAATGGIRITAEQFPERTFNYQAKKYYNMLPGNIRNLPKNKFKKELKKWVRSKIPVR